MTSKITRNALLALIFLFTNTLRANNLEQTKEYINIIPQSRVVIDYGDLNKLSNKKQNIVLIYYALPNGNTIEWTAGKKMEPLDDWHYDIQHIKAQTSYIRENDKNNYYVIAYLQAEKKAWTQHSTLHDSYKLYPQLVNNIEQIVNDSLKTIKQGLATNELMLCSHSGGGRFMFDYISGNKEIPNKVTRLGFIDSNYGYEDSLHTQKILNWLKAKKSHKFMLLSYVDTTVRLNGKPIVSKTGGTGYKTEELYLCTNTKIKQDKSASVRKNFTLHRVADTCFVRFSNKANNIIMRKKENPTGIIYHTVLVEKSGFIGFALWKDMWEEGKQAYAKYIK